MLWSSLVLALGEIRRNLMRATLTMLGIVIGVAAVITMVTLGNGATRAVQDQISTIGTNLLMMRPGQRMGPPEGAPNFKLADAEAIAAQVTSALAVAPVVTKNATVIHQAKNWTTAVTGTTGAYLTAGNWRLADGRTFSETEEHGRAVCIVGETLRRQLFGSQNPVGDEIRIKQFACEVIGLLAPKGQSAMGRDQDDVVLMPLRAVQRRLTGTQDVNTLLVSVQEGVPLDDAKAQITLLMRERRKISGNEENDFNVLDTRQLAEVFTGTTRVMTTLLGAVAAVSLIVGGIGIMNIMLVSVTERTREIGIRLAIGALEREVLLQFLIEAVVLSSLGGCIGVTLAIGASMLLAQTMQVPFIFNPGINLLAFVFSAAIGVVFGYFPARRAARLDPIEALRHE
jgi:putative ABC transport system permease protein